MKECGLQSQTALGLELGAALHCCVTPGNVLGPREAPFPLLETEKKAHTVGLMRRFNVGPWEGSWFLSAGNGAAHPPNVPCTLEAALSSTAPVQIPPPPFLCAIVGKCPTFSSLFQHMP